MQGHGNGPTGLLRWPRRGHTAVRLLCLHQLRGDGPRLQVLPGRRPILDRTADVQTERRRQDERPQPQLRTASSGGSGAPPVDGLRSGSDGHRPRPRGPMRSRLLGRREGGVGNWLRAMHGNGDHEGRLWSGANHCAQFGHGRPNEPEQAFVPSQRSLDGIEAARDVRRQPPGFGGRGVLQDDAVAPRGHCKTHQLHGDNKLELGLKTKAPTDLLWGRYQHMVSESEYRYIT
mmetsp:Transcript_18012/g.51583  ORF Transcript_18012/g.51583 Transcript_18012/m.51583 type:complete len:232 (+) Transcript_18012:413-1108(+)